MRELALYRSMRSISRIHIHRGGRASLPRRGPQTRTGQTPPPANHMLNWLFKYYVTALRWGSAPPPGKCGVLVWGPLLGSVLSCLV